MKMQCTIALLCLFVIAAGHGVNYCGSKMCGYTNSHTFCQFPNSPSPNCIGYIEAELTKNEKSRLLSRLNRRRNEAARGSLRGMPSAGNMLKLRWIEELAKEAQLWANQCRPPSSPEEHDNCRDLFSISVGQCVASVVGEAPGLRVESMVDMWYMQSLLYKGNITSYVPPYSNRLFYGDFGQMMWSRSYMVGCGRSKFMIPMQGRLRSVERLVCNISPAGPVPYRALWSPVAPATACPPRAHPDAVFPSLCNYQFEMDESDVADKTMTIADHVLLNSVLEIERNDSLIGIGKLDEMYLTNLAIVTMDNIESSTTLYNSMQKRDIVEPIDKAIYNVSDKQYDWRKTRKSSEIHTLNPYLSKKKISTIGRPKTYNIEELTEIGDDKDDNEEIIEDVPSSKDFNDIYGDYNIIQRKEETKTASSHVSKIEQRQDATENQILDFSTNSSTTFETINKINDNSTSTIESAHTTNEVADINQINTGIVTESYNNLTGIDQTEMIAKENSEDYLTDSETVRQLQQALDRMERGMQTSKIPVKVRRELKPNVETSQDSTTSPEEDHNKTFDRGPMLNMVLKYMPYLKQYEGELLGKSNSAECVSPSIVLLLFMCF